MADKLIYKGGARVVGHSGGEMQLVQPNGGAMHRFPRWWDRKGSVVYVDAAIFRVTLENGTVVRLVVPATPGAHTLEIRHDGFGNFVFPVKNGIDRVAVVAESDNTIYREYQFAKISGGAMLTRTINPYPTVTPPAPVVQPAPTPKPEPEAAPKKKAKKKTTVEVTVLPQKKKSDD